MCYRIHIFSQTLNFEVLYSEVSTYNVDQFHK